MTGAEFALRVEGADNEYIAREFDAAIAAAMATLTAERDDWLQRHADATTALVTADRRILHLTNDRDSMAEANRIYLGAVENAQADMLIERRRAEAAEQQARDREAALLAMRTKANALLFAVEDHINEDERANGIASAAVAILNAEGEDGQRAAELLRAYEAEHEAAKSLVKASGDVENAASIDRKWAHLVEDAARAFDVVKAAVATVAALRKDGR